MTYLVTGGTGFIGAYVVRDLVRAGEGVVCFDIAPTPRLLEEVVPRERLKDVAIVRGDVTDASQLLHVVKEHKVDGVVHLASLLTTSSEANFPLALRVNCQGTNNVFEAAALFGVAKVVWASSVAAFGPRSQGQGGAIANDAPHDPRTVYGACKAFNERMASHYRRKYGLDITGLRFTVVYGYGKGETVARGSGVDFLDQLIDRPALGLGPCVVPYGDDILDWLYVEDVARAVLVAARCKKPRTGAFTIRGDYRALREVFEHVRRLLPDVEMALRPGTQRGLWHYDGSTALQELGYEAQYRVEEGVERNINMLRRKAGLPLVGSRSVP